jgi:glycosyltransferase involved in cell wall biosynthesis
MRIGMILPGQFPPDIRVEKEIRTLETEHEVSLLCLRRGKQQANETWHGTKITRIFNPAQRWWSQWRLMASCHSGNWQTEIGKFIATAKPDALHVHDLPLLGAALSVARRHRIPVVADLHENYPAMLEDSLRAPLSQIRSLGGLVSRLSVSIDRWRQYEKDVVPQADSVIVVVEEARDRVLQLGVAPDRLYVVGNYATLDQMPARKNEEKYTSDQSPRPTKLVYAGDFGPTRDLSTVLEAVAATSKQVADDMEVQLIGGMGRDLENLRRQAKHLGIADRVTLLQWLPRADAERMMNEADIGLVPHVKSAHTDATIPHKLFQYMWRKLPVIVSDCAPLERVVKESGCGVVYRSGDSQSLAQCITSLQSSRERLGQMGEAGYAVVRQKYNWHVAGEALLRAYRKLK